MYTVKRQNASVMPPHNENVSQASQQIKSRCGSRIFIKILSVTKPLRKCHNDTVLLLLRYWNELQKVVAALGKSRFVAGNTLLKQYTPAQEIATREGGVAPVSGDFLSLG